MASEAASIDTEGATRQGESGGIDSGKSRLIAGYLAVFLPFGTHKWYLGQRKKAILYFFTFNGFYFWGAWQGVSYIYRMDEREFHLRVLGEYKSQGKQHDRETAVTDVPDDAIDYAEGKNGNVVLFEDRIQINRSGISLLQKTQQWGKGDKEILMSNVTSIQFREPSSVTVGYIQFGQEGYVQAGGSQFDAVNDENSVTFTHRQTEKFKEIRDKVRELKEDDVSVESGKDPVETLKQRYAEGEIDKDEFEEKKKLLTED